MQLHGVKGRKPDGSDHADVTRLIQYGGGNLSGAPAETGYSKVIRKGATVQRHRRGELARDRRGLDQAKSGCSLQ